jgi:hypothetical protein
MNSLHLSAHDSFVDKPGSDGGTAGAAQPEESFDDDTETSDPTPPPPPPAPMPWGGGSIDSVDVDSAVEKPGSDGGTIG